MRALGATAGLRYYRLCGRAPTLVNYAGNRGSAVNSGGRVLDQVEDEVEVREPGSARPFLRSAAVILREIAFLLVCVSLALCTVLHWIDGSEWPYSNAEDVAQGSRGTRPQSSRLLIPWMIKGVGSVVSDELRFKTTSAIASRSMGEVLAVASLSKNTFHFPELVFQLGLDVLSLVGVGYLSWFFIKDARHSSQVLRFLCPASVLLAVHALDHYGPHYYYDFPSLCLFTMTLVVRRSSRGWVFYLLLFVTTLCKETSLLLVVPHLLLLPRMRSLAGLLHGTLFAATWSAARYLCIGDEMLGTVNLGTVFIPRNLEGIWELGGSVFASPDGFLLVGFAAVSCFGFWERKPPILRSTLAMVAPFLGLFLIGGYWTETRVLLELVPPVVVASLHSWWLIAWPRKGPTEVRRSFFVSFISLFVLCISASVASLVQRVEVVIADYSKLALVPYQRHAEASDLPVEGSAWDAPSNTRLGPRGVLIDLGGETPVAGFTISVDCNDRYLVRGLHGETPVFWHLVPPSEHVIGMRSRRVSTGSLAPPVVTALHVIPWSGDGLYSYGGLRIEDGDVPAETHYSEEVEGHL